MNMVNISLIIICILFFLFLPSSILCVDSYLWYVAHEHVGGYISKTLLPFLPPLLTTFYIFKKSGKGHCIAKKTTSLIEKKIECALYAIKEAYMGVGVQAKISYDLKKEKAEKTNLVFRVKEFNNIRILDTKFIGARFYRPAWLKLFIKNSSLLPSSFFSWLSSS